MNLVHYFKTSKRITKSKNTGALKLRIWKSYASLLFSSVINAKFPRAHLASFKGNVVGHDLAFPSYSNMLNMFEEIFVYELYLMAGAHRTIIDCGSDIGLSILYFRNRYPDSHILAFEPNSSNYQLLMRNITVNKIDNIETVNAAVSASVGSAKLLNTGNSINCSLFHPNPRTGELVSLVRLSDYVDEEVSILKLDIEGSEGEVIMDLIATDKISKIRNIIIEFHPGLCPIPLDAILTELRRCSFSVDIVTPGIYPLAEDCILYCSNKATTR